MGALEANQEVKRGDSADKYSQFVCESQRSHRWGEQATGDERVTIAWNQQDSSYSRERSAVSRSREIRRVHGDATAIDGDVRNARRPVRQESDGGYLGWQGRRQGWQHTFDRGDTGLTEEEVERVLAL